LCGKCFITAAVFAVIFTGLVLLLYGALPVSLLVVGEWFVMTTEYAGIFVRIIGGKATLLVSLLKLSIHYKIFILIF